MASESTATQKLWQIDAECRGPNSRIFYPPSRPERRDERDRRERRAKAICAACIVRTDCLDYAISINEQHGIWGGLTELERRVMMLM